MDLNVNRNHKDSVFTKLFGTPENLRELYSAIEGVEIPPDAVIKINTLSDALFMMQLNDLSFTINDKLVVLIEHQSTINENIPLRLLMYIGRVYEKIIGKGKKYDNKQMEIPSPEFIVLYNGREKFPEHKELRLSAAFSDISGIKKKKNAKLSLELIVNVYNINHEQNSAILKKCENLKNYSFFINKIKEYAKKKDIDEAFINAVEYCIKHNVLKNFLEEHGSEVINMLFEEYTIEEIAEARAREAREDGLEEGRLEEKIVIAKNMKEGGLSVENIKKFTGLSEEEIQKLSCAKVSCCP